MYPSCDEGLLEMEIPTPEVCCPDLESGRNGKDPQCVLYFSRMQGCTCPNVKPIDDDGRARFTFIGRYTLCVRTFDVGNARCRDDAQPTNSVSSKFDYQNEVSASLAERHALAANGQSGNPRRYCSKARLSLQSCLVFSSLQVGRNYSSVHIHPAGRIFPRTIASLHELRSAT